MADGGFDPCECICSQEGAMRRLLNMLRNSQQICNDQECFTSYPGLQPLQPSDNSFTYLVIGWIVFAFLMFLFRPSSLRHKTVQPKTSNKRDGNGSNEPPSPEIH